MTDAMPARDAEVADHHQESEEGISQTEVAPAISAELPPSSVEPPSPASAEVLPAASAEVLQAAIAETLPAATAEPLPAVQVCVRLRPLLPWEQAEGHEITALELQDGQRGSVTLRPSREASTDEAPRVRGFRFDAVFGPERSQQDLWDLARVDALVEKVSEGFHATVFAYGQTGSGKTHTMEGFHYNHHNGTSAPSAQAARPKVRLKNTPPEQLGIVPRAVNRLFAHAEARQAQARAEDGMEETFCVKVSFLQIYKEKIFDLLNPLHTPAQREAGRGDDFSGLRLRWDAGKRRFFVENLFEYECCAADDVLQHYATGVQNKHMASTAMNVASSRSHTVLVLTLVRRTGCEDGAPRTVGGAAAAVPMREVVSKLALVDLAGSERASASNNMTGDRTGARFQEAVNINQSLFVLRKVISALSKRPEGRQLPANHVPYRESKLTSLLQHAIGGNSFLLMLACLSPSDRHYEENLSTLQYASQAACIKNEPTLNVDPKDRLIEQLRAQLAAAHRYILSLTGLEQLPPELMRVPAACGQHRQERRGSMKRRTLSCEREQLPASAPRSARQTWTSDLCSWRESRSASHDGGQRPSKFWSTAPNFARREALGHQAPADDDAPPDADALSPEANDTALSTVVGDHQDDLLGAPRDSSPSHVETPDSCQRDPSPRHATPDASISQPAQSRSYPRDRHRSRHGCPRPPEESLCPTADILLAAASSTYQSPFRRPAPASGPPSSWPAGSPWPPSRSESHGESSSSRGPRQRARPSDRQHPPPPGTFSKDGLPPIGFPTPRLTCPSSDPLGVYLEAPPGPDRGGRSSTKRVRRRGASQPSPRGGGSNSGASQGEPPPFPAAVRRAPCQPPPDRVQSEDLGSSTGSASLVVGGAARSKSGSVSTPETWTGPSSCRESDILTMSETEAPRPMTTAAEAAVHSGLWEAVEELRLTKTGLEVQLQEAESRAEELQAKLFELQPRSNSETSSSPPSCRSLPGAPAQTSEAVDTSAPTTADTKALRMENETLRRECAQMGERLEEIRTWQATTDRLNSAVTSEAEAWSLVANAEAARAAAEKKAEEVITSMRRDNEAMRSERDSLLDRLDIFERALQVETPEPGGGAAGPEDDNEAGAEVGKENEQGISRLGQKLEKLHSQYVLEVLDLRKELGGLKKKKWVLQSVLARGGENERDAINHEIAELRRTNGFAQKASAAKEVGRGVSNDMLITR